MKINLRDLFWLIFVAAVVTLWWMDHSKLRDRLNFYEAPKPISAQPAPSPGSSPPGMSPTPASPAAVPKFKTQEEQDQWFKERADEWERKWFNPTPEELRERHRGVI